MECRCCSSNSLSRLNVAGRSVQVLGLPTLLQRFQEEDTCPDELFDALRVFNAIPKEFEAEYRQAVMRAFDESKSAETVQSL